MITTRVPHAVVFGALSAPLPACAALTVADFAQWPVDTSGYEIEELPVHLTASYARGNEVYCGLVDGGIVQADDEDPSRAQ